MDHAGESPTDKGAEAGASDETTAAPGAPEPTDTDGMPEETDGDGDADLKEAAAEEGEVRKKKWVDETGGVPRDCVTGCLPSLLGWFLPSRESSNLTSCDPEGEGRGL